MKKHVEYLTSEKQSGRQYLIANPSIPSTNAADQNFKSPKRTDSRHTDASTETTTGRHVASTIVRTLHRCSAAPFTPPENRLDETSLRRNAFSRTFLLAGESHRWRTTHRHPDRYGGVVHRDRGWRLAVPVVVFMLCERGYIKIIPCFAALSSFCGRRCVGGITGCDCWAPTMWYNN